MICEGNRAAAALSIAAMTLALGGCQALGIGGHGIARASAKAENSVIAAFGSEQLEEGRKALSEGRTTDAIDAFMLAKAFEEQAPAAYNGLAVAYSRLGREDLTERFFRLAIALAPEEQRYRSNLATFYMRSGIPRSTGLALSSEPEVPLVGGDAPLVDGQRAVQAPVESPVRSLAAGVTVRTPVSRLQRISSSEVAITSEDATHRPVANTGGHRGVIEVGSRSGPSATPAAHVAWSGSRSVSSRPEYPIRIRFDD